MIASILTLTTATLHAGTTYTIVGTGQSKCYDNRREIAPPKPGQPFYGQDAQHPGPAPSYKLSADGLTVFDNVTGLTWQRSPAVGQASSLSSGSAAGGKLEARPTYSDKLTYKQAEALPAKLNAMKFGGYNDWRLPTVKELYSLILFSGVDGRPEDDSSGMRPFLDTKFFQFAYGDEKAGERIIDSQWATSSLYVANPNQMFGVNFADGRIKGYPIHKQFYTLCVRGNPASGWPSGRGPGGPGRGRPPRPSSGSPRYADVHGAGAQRSDPKSGDPADYPRGRGPQGDVVRIFNYIRLVRGGSY